MAGILYRPQRKPQDNDSDDQFPNHALITPQPPPPSVLLGHRRPRTSDFQLDERGNLETICTRRFLGVPVAGQYTLSPEFVITRAGQRQTTRCAFHAGLLLMETGRRPRLRRLLRRLCSL